MKMNKKVKLFKAPVGKKEKKRVSVRLPTEMLKDIDIRMVEEGKNKKQRSQWISDSIVALSTMSYSSLVSENWLDRGNNSSLQVLLEENADKALVEMIATIKEQDNQNDVASAVVRTAIIHKLMNVDIVF
jgi:hypothetical protein